MNRLLAAVGYARSGLPVLPVGADKAPLTTHGLLDASTNGRTIVGWWVRWPEAGVAIATGHGVSAVDLDSVEASGWFESAMGDRPFGIVVATPRGGLHVWFRDDAGRVRNRVGRVHAGHLLPGFDVRGMGGYLIVPPTPGYDFVVVPEAVPSWPDGVVPADGCDPNPRPVVARPEPVGDRRAYLKAALSAEFDAIEAAPEGTRNDTLNRAAWSLSRLDGLDHPAVAEALVDAAARAGLTRYEAERTVRSAFRARGLA